MPAFGTVEKAVLALTPYIAAEMTRRGNYVFVATLDGVVAGSVSVSTQRGFVNNVVGMFYHALGFWGTARALFVLSFLSDPAPAPDEAYVEVLGVAPEYQRQGIGRALMVAAEAHARGLHKRRLTLYVTSNNHAAQELYRSRGMKVQRRIPSLTGWLLFRAPGFWRMEKPLTEGGDVSPQRHRGTQRTQREKRGGNKTLISSLPLCPLCFSVPLW
jgi:ribosomal protein S18 acetylase RimI-like enzyme